MAVYRYDPATEVFHAGQVWGGSDPSAVMGDGPDYPGAVDGTYYQSGIYTPGPPVRVYHGASIAPHAAAIPAGKDIVGAEVAGLAKSYGDFGSTVTAAVLVYPADESQNVTASRTYPDATPAWSRTVSSLFVPAAQVASFLASAYFDIYQTVPAAGNTRVDWFSLYVSFTVGAQGAATVPLGVSLTASPSMEVSGGVVVF